MATRKVKKYIYNSVIILILIGGLGYVSSRFIHMGNIMYTDNAHVKQHITPINTRVQGFIRKICFEEYQQVKKGDTLVIIEDAEFRLRVAQAKADLANAMAGRKATTAGIATTRNNLSVNDATIQEVKVQMENAHREWKRFEKLLAEDAVTKQQYDQVFTAYETAKARYDQVSLAKQTTYLLKNEQSHRLEQNEAGIQLAEAALELALLNLSYTIITATCDGVIGPKEILEGELVQPGQTLMDIVDASDLWIVANYRESQIPYIQIGAEVTLTADAVPDVVYKGIVERISDATGSALSLIPTDNATGNFVKVEQRIPVRISLRENNPELLKHLRAGLNVECEVKY